MEIDFIKASPTQNMTILVETQIPVENQLAVAQKLISYNSVYAEQAGFIQEPKDKRAAMGLRMMAGEFCGNATLSLAAWLMEQKKLPIGQKETILLEISGAQRLVLCQIQREEQGYVGKVDMPLPISVDREEFQLGSETLVLPVVRFEGIAHIIVDRAQWGEEAKIKAEQASFQWAEKMPDAFGILLWDGNTERLEPLVCLKNTSLIWERGCGSGTSAIGAFLAMQAGGNISLQCKQPGGTMGVQVSVKDGKIASLQIAGQVSIVAKGKAYI
ncbi:MAG: diaminopimelate epimerase [Clostridia bacterium]|nr:diaminopimelate epimerase [Clostridia bacterium]